MNKLELRREQQAARRKEIRAKYDEKVSVRRLAILYDVSETEIRRILKHEGVVFGPRGFARKNPV